jgi:hypothetical protein
MSSNSEMAKKAQERLESAKVAFENTLEGVDARSVFSSYALVRIASSHSDGIEEYMRPGPVAIELAAWLLYPHFGKEGVTDGGRVEEVVKLIEGYQSAYMSVEMAPGDSAKFDELDSHLRCQTGTVRGSSYGIQLLNRIKVTLGHFEDDFRDAIGIGPLRTLDLFSAILAQTEENVNGLRTRFHELKEEERRVLEDQAYNGDVDQVALESIHRALQSTVDGWCSDWVPSRAQIAQRIEGLSDLEWASFAEALGLTVDSIQSIERVVDVQDRPVYFTEPERAFFAHDTSVLDAIFTHFDDYARSHHPLSNRYGDYTSAWMEDTIAAQMQRLFSESCVIQSACFADPDNPGGETEADVVVIWGPFLLVIEAKGKRVSRQAMRGGGKGLRSAIQKNVQDAFVQARRVVKVLDSTGRVTFKEKATGRMVSVSSGDLHRVMPISVTLQHLHGIATQLAVTQQLGLFKGNAYPWSVSIDDLDVITRFATSPDVFLHYIERRTDHQGLGVRLLADELDLFGTYLDNRLHPSIYEASKDISEHDGHQMMWISGGEERFEPYYLAELRGEEPPTGQIKLDIPIRIEEILGELRSRDDDHARWIAFALLGLGDEALYGIHNLIESSRIGPRPTRGLNRRTLKVDDITINVMTYWNLGEAEVTEQVSMRSEIEQYRARSTVTISFAIDLARQGAFALALWSERTWKYEKEMEEVLGREKQRPRVLALPQGAPKVGRNDPCPCGSGMKFKKCCIDNMNFQRTTTSR